MAAWAWIEFLVGISNPPKQSLIVVLIMVCLLATEGVNDCDSSAVCVFI